MKKLVWDVDGARVLPDQITHALGYPIYITSVDNDYLRVRYSEKGQSVIVPAGTIGAHWENVPLPTGMPGDWPDDFRHENGKYQCTCSSCGAYFMGHKRRRLCKICWDKLPAGTLALAPAEALPAPRTIDSAELFQHFRNFRYAKMGVNGLGSAYPDAVDFIDKEVAIRVAETLKGKP